MFTRLILLVTVLTGCGGIPEGGPVFTEDPRDVAGPIYTDPDTDNDTGSDPDTGSDADSGTVDDCDGDGVLSYLDADGDGYGDDNTEARCYGSLPVGYTDVGGDCKDDNDAVNPGATEVCDDSDVDEDCNTLADDADVGVDSGSKGLWFADTDGDGEGDVFNWDLSCEMPAGYTENASDCDDAEPMVHTEATEVCDDVDNNCDGDVDEGDAFDADSYYADVDGDGFGDPNDSETACAGLETVGYIADNTDCDDTSDAVNPTADELCDGIDNNCDGTVDEDTATDAPKWFADSDEDTYGDAAATKLACVVPDGYTSDDTDCDDADALVSPAGEELCNGADDNCDGTIDEDTATDAPQWYADVDADGHGWETSAVNACVQPAGYSDLNDDCDDNRADVSPSAVEVCNGTDSDCDGSIDEGVLVTFYADADEDGHGSTARTADACVAPAGYVDTDDDCDDSKPSVFPGAEELCNSVDDNCDGVVDEDTATDVGTFFADTDGDTFGDPLVTTLACAAPDGFVSDDTDCNDADALVSPAGEELCNGIDDNCDATVDEDTAVDAQTWYADNDLDSFGDPGSAVVQCSAPTSDHVLDNTDCNDTDSSTFPGASEVCNSVDDNCDGTVDEGVQVRSYTDADGDAYGDPDTLTSACSVLPGNVANNADCDDTDSSVNPAASEVCNGIDDNCDTVVDEGVELTFYADDDSDSFGDPSDTVLACSAPSGYVSDLSDCDDTNSSINPTASEVCNTVDDNCDGAVDEGVELTTYADADGDLHGDATNSTTSCSVPIGNVFDSTDCDDTASAVNPAVIELCNGIDDNCDGSVDESTASDAVTWYADADGDLFGDAVMSLDSCSQPSGFVADSTDCDDTDSLVSPGASEVCNSVDDDCDGRIDEGVSIKYFADTDGDTYGDPENVTMACSLPSGDVINSADCDDTDSSVNPAAIELCDGIDNNCDGLTDDPTSIDATTWYADTDGDTYGDATSSQNACSAPAGHVSDSSDCDDAASAVNPVATETCNGIDDNCDGLTDDPTSIDATTWYADTDGDTFGDVAVTDLACSQPSGFVADKTDCDDTSPIVNPAATETCNTVDDNCDGVVDEDSAIDAGTWYADTDSDLFGDVGAIQDACLAPAGHVANSADCDDMASAVNPAASEVCNGIDDDCDGLTDDPTSVDATTWYADTDGDTYGDATSSQNACSAPAGHVSDSSDCDDAAPAVNPGAFELCDTVDNNCDGAVDESIALDAQTWFADSDNDFFGDPADALDSCSQPSGFVADSNDCDDMDASVSPAALEVCDSVDNNCDGVVDENVAVDAQTWYADNDLDGFGDPGSTAIQCLAPADHVLDNTDCDDTASAVNPAASEVCNGIDDNCDAVVDEGVELTFYADVDSDSFGDSSDTSLACSAPSGYVSDLSDCDDTNSSINPSATEVCNGADDNCDGSVDEGVELITFSDLDSDLHGDASSSTTSCSVPLGNVFDATDCDDLDSSVNPAASEICDTIDNNCDGFVDESTATDASIWYEDRDRDGFGDNGSPQLACEGPVDFVSNLMDCDDLSNSVFPGATEVCNGVDDNCNGVVDDGVCGGAGGSSGSDLDGDGIDDAFDLFNAPIAGATAFGLSTQAFTVAYQGEDAFLVGEHAEMGGWRELFGLMRVSSVGGFYIIDFAGPPPAGSPLPFGTYTFTFVSASSVFDVMSPVDQFDSIDWRWADYAGGFCESYSDPYCHLNPDGSYAISLLWNGEISPAPPAP